MKVVDDVFFKPEVEREARPVRVPSELVGVNSACACATPSPTAAATAAKGAVPAVAPAPSSLKASLAIAAAARPPCVEPRRFASGIWPRVPTHGSPPSITFSQSRHLSTDYMSGEKGQRCVRGGCKEDDCGARCRRVGGLRGWVYLFGLKKTIFRLQTDLFCRTSTLEV